jgi:hypothetical protein
VSVGKHEIETQFLALVDGLKPKKKHLDLFRAVALDTWKEKSGEVTALRRQLQQRVDEIRQKKDLLVEAHIYKRVIDEQMFERQRDKLDEQLLPAEAALHHAMV